MSSENDIIAAQDEMTTADVRKSMRVNVFTILTNILLVILICAGLILTDFFRLDSYKFKIQSLNFWLEKLAFAFCTFGIMLGISNSADEISRSKNPEYVSDIMKLKEHYSLLLTEYNDENFKKYIDNVNRAEKYLVYIADLDRRILHSPKRRQIALKRRLLLSPDEVFYGGVSVRYNQVLYSQFAGVGLPLDHKSERGNKYDVPKAQIYAQKLIGKVCLVVGICGFSGDLYYSFQNFNTSMIPTLIVKCGGIIGAIYAGLKTGSQIFERRVLVAKLKLAFYSQFNSRKNSDKLTDENRYVVEIPPNPIVESARKELEKLPAQPAHRPSFWRVFVRTWKQSFGKHKIDDNKPFWVRLSENLLYSQETPIVKDREEVRMKATPTTPPTPVTPETQPSIIVLGPSKENFENSQ